MTDETKKLFDAPWEADACCEIHDKNERLICICCPGEPHIANRIARLPELYDALMGALEIICGIPGEDACDHCSNASLDLGGPCRIREWRELLRKVRAGE